MTSFTPSRRATFRALAPAFVPEIQQADAPQWARLEATVERALAARPPAVRRQLGWLLTGLDALAWLRFGRGVGRCNEAQRTALLEGLARSRALLLRRGVWGLRTLVMLGWYTQPSVIAALGYRASPAGWSGRR